MKKRSSVVTVAMVAISSLLLSSSAFADFHQWYFTEIYSNEDGTVQFIELFNTHNGEQFTEGRIIEAKEANQGGGPQ